MKINVEDIVYISDAKEYYGKGIFTLLAIKKELITLHKEELELELNSDNCEGAHLFLIPTKFYMQEYLEFGEDKWVCVFVQYWG